MVATDVALCSLALGLLGRPAITSLAGTDADSVVANLYYTQARDTLLAAHPWGFATVIGDLSVAQEGTPAADVEDDDWDYVYAQPANALRILRIVDPNSKQESRPFVMKLNAGGTAVYIFTNEEDARAEYIYKVTTVTLFPAYFTETLALYLAMLMAPRLQSRPVVIKQIQDNYYAALARAKMLDCQQQHLSPDDLESNPYIDARG